MKGRARKSEDQRRAGGEVDDSRSNRLLHIGKAGRDAVLKGWFSSVWRGNGKPVYAPSPPEGSGGLCAGGPGERYRESGWGAPEKSCVCVCTRCPARHRRVDEEPGLWCGHRDRGAGVPALVVRSWASCGCWAGVNGEREAFSGSHQAWSCPTRQLAVAPPPCSVPSRS